MASGVSTGKISRRNMSCRCAAFGVGQVLEAADDDALLLQGRQHLARCRQRYCSATSWRTVSLMRSSCSRGGMRSAPEPNGDAGLHLLLQAADADHEELVEVGAEDGQELEPLQQRHLRVLRLFQHAAIELAASSARG